MSVQPRCSQPCPYCGRTIEYSLALIGRSVRCHLCHGIFTATLRSEEGERELDERVERLLAAADRALAHLPHLEERSA
jgi:tRNA(Ile2) C34 agmatinyltransferase TiaS